MHASRSGRRRELILTCAASSTARGRRHGGQQPAPAGAQETPPDDVELLDAFWPGTRTPATKMLKIMVMINCTVCQGRRYEERVALRAGGDIVFWTGLIRKMNTSWNARIQEEDIAPIATYLTKYFGPLVKKPVAPTRGARR